MILAQVQRSADDIFILVFAGIAVILITARVLGWVFLRLGMPAVVGEVIGGIVLGPSLLGLLPGDLDALLFPTDVRPYLRIVAQLGLVVYMFIVGLELDTRVLGSNRRAATTISLASIGVTFALGSLVGLAIHGDHDEAFRAIGTGTEKVDVDLLPFVLFCGLSIAGSAFAILARILEERRLFSTRMGPILVGCAVIDDIAVWALAAVVLAIAASSGIADVPLTLGGLALFVVVLFFVVRPLLARWIARSYTVGQRMSGDLLAVLVVGLLASACTTTWLGISPILGSFLFGAAIPRLGTEELLQETTGRLESLSVLVLLPVFFVVTGLGVDLSKLGVDGLFLLLVFIAVATAGKFVGAAGAARTQGFRGRRAMAVGCLMNTRGLTELAILAIGRDLGILDPTMFTVLVTTAVSTTLLSGPMLSAMYPTALIDDDIAEAERQRVAMSDAYRVLVLVDDPDDAAVADVAASIAASEAGSEVVLSRFGILAPHGELGSGFIGELAAMTTSLDQMAELARRVGSGGTHVVPLSQFTDDVDRALVEQVVRMRPSLVVLADRGDDTWVTAERVVRQARTDVLVAAPAGLPEGTVVRLANGEDPDVILAAEIAVRLALGSDRLLAVESGRRAAALAPAMLALGAQPAPADLDDLLVIEVRSGRSPGAHLAVLAPVPIDGRRTLEALKQRLGPRQSIGA